MKIRLTETCVVARMLPDGKFKLARLQEGQEFQCITNDCGPVFITLKAMFIVPKNKAIVT